MSHLIFKKDTCVTLEPAWHGLETIVEEINYETSGLNWTVERRNLFLEDQTEVKTHQAVFSPEKDEIINVAQDSYELIQNSRLFEVIENSFAGINHKIVSAGSLGNCKRIYLSVALEDNQNYVVNRENFKNYLNFVSSHDGSVSLECFDSSVRQVCWNTVQWSRQQKGILDFKIRHSKNAESRITNMEEKIEQLFEKRQEFYSSYEYLASRPMSLDRAEKILTGFVASSELSTRAENTVKEIHNLFVSGKGNNGKTYADLLNGCTEFWTHGREGSNPAKSFASSEFGSGSKKKLDFWSAINDETELDRLAKRGELLLTA